MRLRLVVRRNGLPELRLMWHVQLGTNPTISKLLEQLNDHVPLEGEHWGLEDYVVELHDNDGTNFECLHYQLVRDVLKPDDRVFVRVLDQDDRRRRRTSGRLQISSDGRHLVDGVPFGRPRLRAPTGRPAVHIPPRKRARLTYTQQDGAEHDSPTLLLTDGRELKDGDRPSHLQIPADPGDTDSDTDDQDFACDDDDDLDDSSTESSYEEQTDNEIEEAPTDHEDEDDEDEDEEDEEDGAEVEGLDQEARELAVENAALEVPNPPRTQTLSLDTLDKLTALRATFPTAPVDLLEKVLAASQDDLRTTYNVLSEGFDPQMSQEAIVIWKPGAGNLGVNLGQSHGLVNSASTDGIVSGLSTRKRKLNEHSPVEDSDNDDDDGEGYGTSLWRKYDHAGFPPGTITSGTGLSHMAAISASFGSSKVNGNSEATSATLKALTAEPVDEDDDTSSSGSSSDSSASDESDDASDEESSSEGSRSSSSSAESSDADSESSDTSSEGPRRRTSNDGHIQSSSGSDSGSDSDSDSDSGSDSGPEEYPFETANHKDPTAVENESDESSDSSDGTSDDSSDSESSGTDSNSESGEDADDRHHNTKVPPSSAIAMAHAMPQARPASSNPMQTNPASIPVPPGAGKESTKRRNVRRRAAKLAKKEVHRPDDQITNSSTTIKGIPTEGEPSIAEKMALFEAKRKALLDAIATGGIEVGPSGETTLDHTFAETDGVKRKRTGQKNSGQLHDKNKAAVETTDELLGDDREESSPSQKRRRIDLGVSRRLVFGALGLRNPKNKQDEDKMRDKLQTDAQPRATQQPSSQPRPPTDEVVSINDDQDINAWKLKINYRAVECCQDGIELSPAPFPFQQRWDPQQQYLSASKKNKRGGQSKRAQRNHSQYYDDDVRPGKKREHYNSSRILDSGYGHSHDGYNAAPEVDVMLNYDDTENQDHNHDNDPENEISQVTDLDDLPSLPKDVSVLPLLRLEQAKIGMVITWQKWSCSSATSWQPQLSRVTAIVATVDNDAAELKVCLAKRDRCLDGNEKRYDNITGQRIYDRFEAPDLGEDDGADGDQDDADMDEGYRIVPWTDIQDPRILQEPLEIRVGLDTTSEYIDPVETGETVISLESQPNPTMPLPPSQQEVDVTANPAELIGLEPVQSCSEKESFSEIPESKASPELGESWVESHIQAAN